MTDTVSNLMEAAGEPVETGFDAAIVRNERICELYTVVDT